MEAPTTYSQQPVLTRKSLRKYSRNMAGLYLPKELEDYLLDSYNDDDTWLDDEGHQHRYSLTQEDIWYNIRRPIMEYAQIKDKMDELLSATEYLGNCSLTIKVKNRKSDLPRWPDISAGSPVQRLTANEDDDDIPF